MNVISSKHHLPVTTATGIPLLHGFRLMQLSLFAAHPGCLAFPQLVGDPSLRFCVNFIYHIGNKCIHCEIPALPHSKTYF